MKNKIKSKRESGSGGVRAAEETEEERGPLRHLQDVILERFVDIRPYYMFVI